ncbi:MAG: sensor domain-containing protein [Anaerolineaceae bacterium]|nr:sensor domain-containing protein [Anaerolineaceae bacterium]
MTKSVAEYLNQLKKELAGCDSATIQDALSDAEEHLRTALSNLAKEDLGIKEADALPAIIEEYGSAEETAAAYRDIEARMYPALAHPKQANGRSAFARFFGVLAEPRAWGALFYMLISLVTGTIYFSWAVIGLSTSIGLIILIIGLPVTGLFLLSVRGIALVEGQIIEALLGVRMPRRRLFVAENIGIWEKSKTLISDKHTWLVLTYMVLMMPLGVLYFSVFVILISLALSFLAVPVVQLLFHIPVVHIINASYFMPNWSLPLMVIAGILTFFATMHLAKIVGQFHGKFAKTMLVSE